MKWIYLLFFTCANLYADYPAWFGTIPAFRYQIDETRPCSLTVAWAPGVTWPETVPRHVRESRTLSKDMLDTLVASFGKGPWNVYLEANDGKGFWVLSRRVNDETAGIEPDGQGVPHLLTVAERLERAKALLVLIGFPVDTLVTRQPTLWVESEGAPGDEKVITGGIGVFATVDGYRLFPASAQSASVGFDRYGRTTELRMIWRKTVTDGMFSLISQEQAEAAIVTGKAYSLHFGFAQEWGAPPTPEHKAVIKALANEAEQSAILGIEPPSINRRIVITDAELVLLDYASEEGIYGDEDPMFGKFDDILWPMLLLRAEVFTNGHRETGEIMLPADTEYITREASKALFLPEARTR
jgi:hypothetical protein